MYPNPDSLIEYPLTFGVIFIIHGVYGTWQADTLPVDVMLPYLCVS